jgi:hypothetical protein
VPAACAFANPATASIGKNLIGLNNIYAPCKRNWILILQARNGWNKKMYQCGPLHQSSSCGNADGIFKSLLAGRTLFGLSRKASGCSILRERLFLSVNYSTCKNIENNH